MSDQSRSAAPRRTMRVDEVLALLGDRPCAICGRVVMLQTLDEVSPLAFRDGPVTVWACLSHFYGDKGRVPEYDANLETLANVLAAALANLPHRMEDKP